SRRRAPLRRGGEPCAGDRDARGAARLGHPLPVAHARGGRTRPRADVRGDRARPLARCRDARPGLAVGPGPQHRRRAARRCGGPRPIVRVAGRDGVRRATLSATGWYRWVFRGGASAQAYRALVAALADWLLDGEGGRGKGARAVPQSQVVANGLPLVWRWVGTGQPSDVVVRLVGNAGERVDTLHFDAAGPAEMPLR